MLPQSQKITAAFTSAIVLVTSLYCACYGTNTARASTARNVPAQVSGHCHSHHAEKSPQKSDSPSPEKDHEPTCQHCDQVTAAPEPGTQLDTQQAHHHWAAIFVPLLGSANLLDTPVQPHCTQGDLPPPLPASTLLSLHCALVI